ncbi:hypothetical protein ACTMTI_20220 [Nonomuraea sp. H19]
MCFFPDEDKPARDGLVPGGQAGYPFWTVEYFYAKETSRRFPGGCIHQIS